MEVNTRHSTNIVNQQFVHKKIHSRIPIMKFTNAILIGLGLVASSTAHPVEERDVQVAHLTFHGGPASYDLSVPADGSVVNTSEL